MQPMAHGMMREAERELMMMNLHGMTLGGKGNCKGGKKERLQLEQDRREWLDSRSELMSDGYGAGAATSSSKTRPSPYSSPGSSALPRELGSRLHQQQQSQRGEGASADSGCVTQCKSDISSHKGDAMMAAVKSEILVPLGFHFNAVVDFFRTHPEFLEDVNEPLSLSGPHYFCRCLAEHGLNGSDGSNQLDNFTLQAKEHVDFAEYHDSNFDSADGKNETQHQQHQLAQFIHWLLAAKARPELPDFAADSALLRVESGESEFPLDSGH